MSRQVLAGSVKLDMHAMVWNIFKNEAVWGLTRTNNLTKSSDEIHRCVEKINVLCKFAICLI